MRSLPVCISAVCSFFALFSQTVCAAEQKCSVEPVELRCEYLRSPLGIDTAAPRLSWRLRSVDADARGAMQTAYEVLVAGSLDLLAADKADMWKSGLVASGESAHVVYAGKPLRSGAEYFWKVRVKDQNGALSQWSQPARWTIGLLEQSDWKAQWIGTDQIFERQKGWPPPDNTIPDPWLRRTFTLKDAPRRAMIYVASIGYHELYVNGQKVDDTVLAPAVANHRKRARYVTYDITRQLKQGENAVCLWLGMSWSIFPHYKTDDKPETAIVIAQADIDLPSGERLSVGTDAAWKTHPSPNTLLGVWDFMHFGGESYDANRELPGWNTASFDDSQWQNAVVYHPQVVLSAEMIEPNRCIRKITPVSVAEVAENTWRVDLGVNMNGWFEMDIDGAPGDVVAFEFSERQDQPMTHRLHSRYIVGPSGKGTFKNRFNYFTGRWVQVKGLKNKPSLDSVRAYLVRTDYRRTGHFECSNDLLNRIYDTTLWTYENLSLGGYVVDCSHRERMGYGGDGHATTETGLDNYDLGAFYSKWSQDWRDVQGKTSVWGTENATGDDKDHDGNLPYTAPTYWGGGGPAWSGFCITLPWEVYQQYGDTRILEVNLPTIEKWLSFLETKSADDMLVRWGGQWDFLGDWLWPGAEGVNGDTTETLFFNNCYWIYNLTTAAKICDVLNRPDLASKYRRRADSVRRAVDSKFYNPAENGYVNNMQAYLAVALLVDLPPDDIRPKVWKTLEDEILVHRKGHFWGGITGGYFITEALTRFDRPDLMLEMVSKDTWPSWGDMLNKGATSIWEAWDGSNSLLHSSYLFVGAWFIEGLAGIRPSDDHPGFRQFVIRPFITSAADLNWVKASYESIYGEIKSEWKTDGDRITLNVVIPPNTSAEVYVPGDIKSITESGKPAAKAKGLKVVSTADKLVVFKAAPGSYTFTSTRP
jgi:alpha-L-rhamnosidase